MLVAPRGQGIVEIDEQTLRALEPVAGRWPWPRLMHSALIDFLARGPAAVVLDPFPTLSSPSAAPRSGCS